MAAEAGAGLLSMEGKSLPRTKNQYSLDVETQVLGALRKNDIKQIKKAYEKFVYILPEDEDAVRVYLRRLAVRVEFSIEDSYGLIPEMKQSFRNFYDAVDTVNPPKGVNILYQLLLHIIELRSNMEEDTSREYFQDYIPVALNYIRENLQDENLSIGSVSEHVYLNPVYFGRIFKSVMKMPFKRYVQNMRMEKAKELILEDQESIANICVQVGIPNPSYFSQVFKQYTGILPSEYKRSLEA